jgi:hypothetical protein
MEKLQILSKRKFLNSLLLTSVSPIKTKVTHSPLIHGKVVCTTSEQREAWKKNRMRYEKVAEFYAATRQVYDQLSKAQDVRGDDTKDAFVVAYFLAQEIYNMDESRCEEIFTVLEELRLEVETARVFNECLEI